MASITKTARLLVLTLFVISAVILPNSICHGARGVAGPEAPTTPSSGDGSGTHALEGGKAGNVPPADPSHKRSSYKPTHQPCNP